MTNQKDLVNSQDMITLCDYETCPTVKRNNAINTINGVKSDGMLHSIKAGRNYSYDNHYEFLENRAVGVSLL